MSLPEFGTFIDEIEPITPKREEFGEFVEESKGFQKQPIELEENILRKFSKTSEPTRIAGQLSARGLESILSVPRSVGDFLQKAVPKETLIKGAEKVGLGKGARTLLEATEKYSPHKLFPTQEQTRKFTKDLFGDLYEPKNSVEEKVGETFGEFASLVFPFMGAVKPLRAFLLATGANAAKETGEWLGLSDKKSNLMKLGTYVVGSLIHPKFAENFYKRNFKEAKEILPENATVSSTRLDANLNSLEKGMMKGGISSADKPALQQIKNLKAEMQGAQTPVDALVEFKKKINIARGDIYKQLEGNKSGIKTANRNLEMVSHAADKALQQYAKQDPTWGKLYREANNAFAAVQSSRRATKFLKGKIPHLGLTHIGLSVLLGHMASLKTIALGGAVGGVTAGASIPVYNAAQTLNKIMRSPPLRREYFKLMQESAKGNLPAVSKSAHLLDKGLQKLDE